MESQSKSAKEALNTIKNQLCVCNSHDVKNPILDVVIMYCEKDMKYLPEAISTLPEFCNVILVETISTNTPDWQIEVKNIQNGLIEAILTYPNNDFQFDKARNLTNQLCESDWILQLDADERLLTHQHGLLLKYLRHLDSDYWAINTGLVNNFNFQDRSGLRKKEIQNVVKIYRNNGVIKYEYPIHETVCIIIDKHNKMICDSEIIIHHVGYEIPVEELIKKLDRNIMKIWEYSYLRNIDIFKNYLEKSIISINQLRGYSNG